MVRMMSRFAWAAFVALASAVPVAAQDPTKSLPDSYQVQLENAYVKVVRVHYGAGATLPDHTHPAGTTVYVYLNDSEGVVFRHSGNNNRSVTRPPVRAGSVRVAAGPEEHHTAENPASTPSDFLRIWFKTDSGGERNLRRRITPGAYLAGESVTDEQFVNKQMRITRLVVAPGGSMNLDAKEPALLIDLPSGNTRWLEAGARTSIQYRGDVTDLLLVAFLTAPGTR